MSSPRRNRRALDGILLLDKPLGLSSNTALQIVKRLYNAEKAGHTGSLDPLASGLLPLCFGQATKLGAYLLDADKRYRARARLGTATSSGDAEGEVVASSDPSTLSRAQLEAAIPQFLGRIRQVPPMYSALKRDGQPLYRLARAGIEVEREAREVSIHELKLLDFADGEFEFDLRCSKGTYVRTLAEDWAAAVNQRAHLSALRRTGVGSFDAGAMVPLERLEAMAPEEAERQLLPPAAALAGWPEVEVDAGLARQLAHGQAVRAGQAEAGLVAVYGPGRALLGIAGSDGAGGLAPKRWLTGSE